MDMPEGIPAPIMTSSTEVMLPGSETPVTAKVGQVDEGVQVLSKADFQKASAIQKARDRAIEEEKENGTDAAPKTPTGHIPAIAPSPAAPSGARQSGKPSPVRQTTSTPNPTARKRKSPAAVTDPRFNQLESRIAEMEEGQALIARGMDKVIEMIAARDLRESIPTQNASSAQRPRHPAAAFRGAGGEEKEVEDAATRRTEDFGPLALTEELEDEDLDFGGSDDAVDVLGEEAGDDAVPGFEEGDPHIARLQAHIARKNPLKDFRRFWASVTPRAGFTEWPIEMQTQFTDVFTSTVNHPKLLHQVRRAMLKMRNGQCIGEEQMYKVVLMLAGHCVLYSLITQES